MAPAHPRSDIVAGQYGKWMYPEPIADLPAWLAHNWQWFDPSHSSRVLWPDRPHRSNLQILVAGCGTNQAAVLAYTNPEASITAIDVSQPSLDQHASLKQRYGLRNLELHLLPIEEVASLDSDFDLIISTGVLHHLADPQAGMNALARRLRPDGVIAIMLYARYGRIGVEMLQGVFRELGLAQDQRSIEMVRDALAVLPPDHPVASYLAIAPDLAFDSGIVDTFLHGRERSYTVEECLELVESAGLAFQDWFLRSPYEPWDAMDNRFLSAVAALPDRARWSAMERINTRNGCHFFTACRSDRPGEQCRIDFGAPGASAYVPEFRYRHRMEGSTLILTGWHWELEPAQAAFARGIDGRRTIAELSASTGLGTADALELARSLRMRDAIAIHLPNTHGPH